MLLNTNREFDYMYKLMYIMNHFDNYYELHIRDITRRGYRIVTHYNLNSFSVTKDILFMYYDEEEKQIRFYDIHSIPIAKYTLKEDNTLDKIVRNSENEPLIEEFINGLYEELQLLRLAINSIED